jgi:hypothetical protein
VTRRLPYAQKDEPDRHVTRGARAFLRWLAKKGLTPHEISKEKGWDPREVIRNLNGERQSMRVDLAIDFHDATGGDIPIRWFGHKPAVRRLLFERRSTRIRKGLQRTGPKNAKT